MFDILYVGNPERGQALHAAIEPQGGWVYVSEAMLEALGMYITYMPRLIVIDSTGDAALAADVYHHLLTVDAGPLVVLADAIWDHNAPENVATLPPPARIEELTAALHAILNRRQDVA